MLVSTGREMRVRINNRRHNFHQSTVVVPFQIMPSMEVSWGRLVAMLSVWVVAWVVVVLFVAVRLWERTDLRSFSRNRAFSLFRTISQDPARHDEKRATNGKPLTGKPMGNHRRPSIARPPIFWTETQKLTPKSAPAGRNTPQLQVVTLVACKVLRTSVVAYAGHATDR